MQPYSTPARARDRLSTALCLTFAALALAAFYLASLLSSYRAVIQTAGFLALTAMVYIMARNRIPYFYAIEQEADGVTWDLVISRLKGKHRVTVCRLATHDVREIDVEEKTTRAAIKEKYRDDTVHNYSPTLFPERSLYLRFEDSDPYAIPSAVEEEGRRQGTRIVIRIAYDPTLYAMLRSERK